MGVVRTDASPADKSLAEHLTSVLEFRGPDGSDVWADGPAAFGHALLRTTDDASEGEQPLSLDNRFWITADARIDARDELKEKLVLAGEQPSADVTDAGLLLHAWRVWREEMMARVIGDFAFAIWDCVEQRLFLARDHMGVKPLYYAILANEIVVSNTVACIRAHPGVSSQINERAIGDFLIAGWNYDPATTSFAGILQLPPAHFLTLRGSTVRTGRYWTVPFPTETRFSDSREYLERFTDLVRRATYDRVRGARVSVFMSGGLDSPAVAYFATEALGARGSRHSPNAISVTYSHGDGNERHFARLAAERIGIPITFLHGDEWPHFREWHAAARHNPYPADNSLLGFTASQAMVAAGHGRVVLTGFDGDALLSQSRSAYLRHLLRTGSLGGFARNLFEFVRTQGRLPTFALLSRLRKASSSGHEYYPHWLNADFERSYNLRGRFVEVMSPPVPEEYLVREHAYRFLTTQGWNRLLTDADPGVSRRHLEVRHPLADVRLVEFCMALPQVPWCLGKHILRESMRGKLPDPVLDRRKTGMAAIERGSSDEHGRLIGELGATPEVERFVNIGALPLWRTDGRPESYWLHTRPLQLAHWLGQLDADRNHGGARISAMR